MNDVLEKARLRKIELQEQGLEIERLTPDEKARRNPKSLRFAINAKCWDCSSGQRIEIKNCVVTKCALWNVRPYQDQSTNDNKE